MSRSTFTSSVSKYCICSSPQHEGNTSTALETELLFHSWLTILHVQASHRGGGGGVRGYSQDAWVR